MADIKPPPRGTTTNLEAALAMFHAAQGGAASAPATPSAGPDEVFVTGEMKDLYARGLAIYRQGKAGFFEKDGGRLGELYEIEARLHQLCGGKPWQDIVFKVLPETVNVPPPPHLNSIARRDWVVVRRWRKALDASVRT
jgi:hypothetical protein